MYMSDDNKPIGWWLKEVDRLLEESFERVLADDGLTRRQWQALNAAAGHSAGHTIAEALSPFLSRAEELAGVTGPLIERGWLTGETLTPDGERALQALSTKVQAQRRRVTAGVSDSEYLTTVGVLRRMAANLA
ncbi:hypothetical protein [Kribbella sp. C-35]|uniref:hypothetical protein n=1 Tax=Kribbella sp. C-35 TaxID=2789276 RepID=UPI00397E27C0